MNFKIKCRACHTKFHIKPKTLESNLLAIDSCYQNGCGMKLVAQELRLGEVKNKDLSKLLQVQHQKPVEPVEPVDPYNGEEKVEMWDDTCLYGKMAWKAHA
jgi:hypothetical protein